MTTARRLPKTRCQGLRSRKRRRPLRRWQKKQNGQRAGQNANEKKNSGSTDRQDGRRSENPRDSQERTDSARSPEAEKARRAQMIKDVWGHLPPHIREAIQNAVNDKYHPK